MSAGNTWPQSPQWSGDDLGDVAMPRFDNPIVLVTRPAADAQRFVDALCLVSNPFDAMISPAFEYKTLLVKMPNFGTAIFTSQAGVVHAPHGAGRLAFCVGDATATAAQDAGYVSISASGSADDLVRLILRQRPNDTLLHIRGAISSGGVAERLSEAGLQCQDVVAYRKAARRPSQLVCDALDDSRTVIVPLFSTETVSILQSWSLHFDDCRVVAISEAVAVASAILSPRSIVTSDAPNIHAMAQTTSRLIA
ncbi:MAG: uroporphyrinogen-III synthase [Gammaproteobacteria bacterium]|jgi:uroporphyrinogen-III synthase